jgi:hypothetical protein
MTPKDWDFLGVLPFIKSERRLAEHGKEGRVASLIGIGKHLYDNAIREVVVHSS